MNLQPKTVYRLMLAAFTLVALPLMFGLLVLFFQIDRLSVQMQNTVNQSAAVMENSRLVTTQALGIKRSAEQYLILSDPTLLARYRDQRKLLRQSIQSLQKMPLEQEMASNLQNIENVEARLMQELDKISQTLGQTTEQVAIPAVVKPTELNQLSLFLENVPILASRFVDSARIEMKTRAQKSKNALIILLITLVPTAIVLAFISSTVINRPLKKVISLIKRMGQGEFPEDTHVGGPQNIAVVGEHLRWLSEKLSQIEQQKLTFLQTVSHELKTPLTAIREGADLMHENVVGDLNAEQMEVLEIINQNTYLLQNQLESLLDFNLALTMDEPYPQVPVNIKQVMEKIIDKLHLILKSRAISIVHDTPPARIIGNQAQLETLFENIFTNAIKFSPPDSRIMVRTDVSDDGITVVIEDDGPGFNEKEVDQVFKPFFQGEKSPNTHIKGTGLGLSIAKRYVDLHGGEIEVTNTGSGAAVKVVLPLNTVVHKPEFKQAS